MVEVFITEIQHTIQAEIITNAIQSENAELKINFDFNETALPFPCGHTLRQRNKFNQHFDIF